MQSCMYFDKDLDFQLRMPEGYQPSHAMRDLTCDQWKSWVDHAEQEGHISKTLAEKIITSLNHMPEVEPGQKVGISFSGGKDSQAISILSKMKYPKEILFAMFADTKDEWPQTYDFLPVFEQWIGYKVNQIESMGIHHLLRHVTPVWPKMGTRHCTKQLKMNPQRDFLDEQGYDQVRYDKQPAMFRDAVAKKVKIEVTQKAPLLMVGERRHEGQGRSKVAFNERNDVLLRHVHRPVADWDIVDIWEFLFWMKSPINPVYLLGIKRCACAGCIFANPEELRLLGIHNPQMLDEWVETERIIASQPRGITRPGKKSLKEIRDELFISGEMGWYEEDLDETAS